MISVKLYQWKSMVELQMCMKRKQNTSGCFWWRQTTYRNNLSASGERPPSQNLRQLIESNLIKSPKLLLRSHSTRVSVMAHLFRPARLATCQRKSRMPLEDQLILKQFTQKLDSGRQYVRMLVIFSRFAIYNSMFHSSKIFHENLFLQLSCMHFISFVVLVHITIYRNL